MADTTNRDLIIGGLIGGVVCTAISALLATIPFVQKKHEDKYGNPTKKSNSGAPWSETIHTDDIKLPAGIPLSVAKKISYPGLQILSTSGQLGNNPANF
jgi:hypothetical protein